MCSIALDANNICQPPGVMTAVPDTIVYTPLVSSKDVMTVKLSAS